jgi:hypothetical protein
MIPGELTVDNSFTVDVSDDFTGTIAIGQAELHGHFGLTGSLGGTKRYGAVSTKANSQVVTFQSHSKNTTSLHHLQKPAH